MLMTIFEEPAAMKMKAGGSSEMFLTTYMTTWCNNPDQNLKFTALWNLLTARYMHIQLQK